MEPTSYSADKALAEALTRLAAVEQDNVALKKKLQQLTTEREGGTKRRGGGGGGGGGGGDMDTKKLEERVKELMHVNNQWDLEYKELESTFTKYRIDSKQAQGESQSLLAKLKEVKEALTAEIRELQAIVGRKEKEVSDLRGKIRTLEDEVRSCRFNKPVVSQDRLRELEEESEFLRQQLKTYREDFEAERRDREKMSEKRENAAVRYEAEVTSLRLQLERCRNELAHYTAEANRLSQQLRLKSQIEEEQYKRHLESNGYITRSASGHLPPLDPFVDIDEESGGMKRARSPRNTTTSSSSSSSSSAVSSSTSPRLLTRGVDLVQAYSNSQAAAHQYNDRSRSPIMHNGSTPGQGQGYHVANGRPVSPSVMVNGSSNLDQSRFGAGGGGHSNGFRPSIPPSMMNGQQQQVAHHHHHNGYNMYNTHSNNNNSSSNNNVSSSTNGLGPSYYNGVEPMDVKPVRPAFQVENGLEAALAKISSNNVVAPPLQTTGKYSCPRCERKFDSKKLFSDHKTRCIV